MSSLRTFLSSKNFSCRTLLASSSLQRLNNLLHPYSPHHPFSSFAYQHEKQAGLTTDQPHYCNTHVNLSTLSFDDHKTAYGSINSTQLLKHATLLQILRIPGLASNSQKLLNLSHKIIGQNLTNTLVKATMFNHFCGGEDLEGLILTAQRLNKLGIGCIVDYAAESEEISDNDAGIGSDLWMTKNVELLENAVYSAAKIKETSGTDDFTFVAVKVTALSSPKLLRKLTTVLNFIHYLFSVGSNYSQFNNNSSALFDPQDHDILMNKVMDQQQFKLIMKSVWAQLTDAKISEMFKEAVNLKGSIAQNKVSYFQWKKFLSPKRLLSLPPPVIPSHSEITNTVQKNWLTQSDVEAIDKVTQRIDRLASSAKNPEVRLLIDAEQTFFQSAIDYFVSQQQEKWNSPSNGIDLKSTSAIIYNTNQMYLKNALSRLIYEAKQAEIFGYKHALKMVRGAYMFQEHRCAEQHGYKSPVHDTMEDTHHCYDSGVKFMMNRLDQAEVLFGTHNENSTKLAARLIAESHPGVNPRSLPVSFGQLLGMCDHVSLMLTQAGCKSYKYVPYGPVDLVTPYLIRRAEENSSLISSSSKETSLIWSELRHRLLARCGMGVY